MSTKIYIGKGKQVKHHPLINMTLDLNQLLQEAYQYKEKDLVNITISKLKKPDAYGKTHTAFINHYVPKK